MAIVLALIPVLAVGLADAVIAVRTSTPSTTATAHTTTKPKPNPAAAAAAAAARRAEAVDALLTRRSDAVVHRNRAAFLATVDPTQKSFRASQAREFDALMVVPFASWSYDFDPSTSMTPTSQSSRYRVPSWTPDGFTLHYQIRGFDAHPTSLRQYPTFVQRHGHWYIASFSDYQSAGDRSDVDIWDFGAIRIVRAPHVLVLGHPSSLDLMRALAQQASDAIPRVTAVWGNDWARQVVVLVPSTQHELARLVDDNGDLSQIAAVASAEVQQCPGPPDPVGGRVAVNPANWSKLSALGQRVVLTHELTHVATREDTGSCTPTWLVEGFADYVGYLNSGVPVQVIAQELAHDVRAGKVPTRLPPDSDFDGASKRLAQAYEGAWLACRLIVAQWGQPTLVRFYREVGTSTAAPQQALDTAIRRVLHTTPSRFVASWRAYLRSQLS